MKIGAVRILGTLSTARRAAWSVPGKYKYLFLLKPLDATRYLELGYLLEFLDRRDSGTGAVLDVSSPVMLSYILARKGFSVTKADISPVEAKFILRAAFWDLLTGPFFFETDPGTFEESRLFGNAQWILRVKEGQVDG